MSRMKKSVDTFGVEKNGFAENIVFSGGMLISFDLRKMTGIAFYTEMIGITCVGTVGSVNTIADENLRIECFPS